MAGAASEAAGQVIIRRGPGLVIRAPYAPPIAIGVRAAVPPLPVVRPYVLPRRRALAASAAAAAVAQQASLASRATARYVAGATTASAGDDRPLPTAEELAALDDGSLLNAVLDIAARLDAALGAFNTGATWQRHLRLPDDAFPPPSEDNHVDLGFTSITNTLERLNSVEANPNYAMISRLPSFAGLQLALEEVVSRLGRSAQPAAATPAARPAEELPPPPPSLAAPENASGQRSILAR